MKKILTAIKINSSIISAVDEKISAECCDSDNYFTRDYNFETIADILDDFV
jgi:hypothetical protein